MAAEKETVHEFMKSANRPFSSNDVFSGLQRQGVGKSAVDKALDQLVKENKVYVKLYGKQKVYCVVQPDSTAEDQKEIAAMDEELLKTNEALREAERKYKQSETEVKTLRGTCSVDEARSKVAELEKTVSELRAQLDGHTSKKAGEVVSEKDKVLVKKDYEKIVKEYKKRKRMCTDILDSILENCPKTKKALFEEIGIETDESAGMPSLPWTQLSFHDYVLLLSLC